MATTIKIKSTTVSGRKPTVDDIAVSELALNIADRKLFSRNADGIFEVKCNPNVPGGDTPPTGDNMLGDLYWDSTTGQLLIWDGADWVSINAELALGELTDVDTRDVSDGKVLAYDSGTWKPVTAASLSVDVDLSYTAAADKGTVTNTAGDDAEIPLSNGTNAGLSLNNYTTAEKDKLESIAEGADVTPDLGNYVQKGGPVSDLDNDAGYITAAEIPEATGFVKLDDEGTEQSIVGGGGLDVAGGITSEFGTNAAQLGNVAPLNDWSCYPPRPTTLYVRPTPPPPPAPEPVDPGFGVDQPSFGSGQIISGVASGGLVGTQDIIDLGGE